MPCMPAMSLPQVSLCAIDTRSPHLALQSLQRSMLQVAFAEVLLFCPPGFETLQPQIRAVPIAVLRDGAEYSNFVLRELAAHIHTRHVLLTQWDGFVLDASAWQDEFLAWDYIGAPWPDQPDERAVGNGGFSLRSRRCLVAGQDPALQPFHPEDQALCVTHRERMESVHGLRFAPRVLAQQFAFENRSPKTPTFGFHGPYNLPRVLDEATLQSWLKALPDDFYRSRDARRLARSLLARGMADAAVDLLSRRQAAGRQDPNTRLLATAARCLQRIKRV